MGEQGEHDLVPKGDEVLVVVNLLNKNHAITVGGVYSYVVSYRGEHLLLERPGTWVQGDPTALIGEAPVWQYSFEEFTAWI